MTEAQALIEQAIGHLNAQRPADAVARYLEALRRDPTQEQAWLGLALALGLAGQLGDVVGLAEFRQRQRGDGFLFFHAALGSWMTYRLHGQILALAQALPQESPFLVSAAYHAGSALLLNGQEDAAFSWFARFKIALAGQSGRLPIGPESHFNVAYRQGTLIEDHAFVDALAAHCPGQPQPPNPVFCADPIQGQDGVVLAAACDGQYFARFAEGFIASAGRIHPAATLHLHVIEPLPDFAAVVARLMADYGPLALNFSTEPAGPLKSGAYYASSRFLLAPALLARYGGPLLLADIDVEWVGKLDPLLVGLAKADFACFRHDGAGPCSRYPAVLTGWTNGEAASQLLDRLGRFLRAKLDIPWPYNWMLDQAALASVLRWSRIHRPEIQIGIWNDLTGQHFQPWIRPVGGDEKAALIRAAEKR